MAIAERIAAGGIPKPRDSPSVNESGNVCRRRKKRADVWRGGRRRRSPTWAGRALRVRMLVETALLAGRHRGVVARDRRQRGDLQPVQGARAEAAAWCRRRPAWRSLLGAHYRRGGLRVSCPTIATSRHISLRRPERVGHDLCERRTAAPSRADRCGARHRQLLPDARCRRATRPRAAPADDVAPGSIPVAVISDAVAPLVRRRSGDRRQDALPQRPAADDRWRGRPDSTAPSSAWASMCSRRS